ncbi:SUKH-4 family immunity protein [Streptomyces sp. NPDC005438]|uniref:SUKH-4 family immunity protein n=1 Tax=Streptomyces sp. NPDC005438 TaxID=3156880 RepID=UPI0033A314E7
MVTLAQVEQRAERWINGEVPAYQRRQVRVREFEQGFVAWAEDRAEGATSDGGHSRLVVARDSGEATLWPPLPVDEVIRRWSEAYGGGVPEPAPAQQAQRLDLEATSFLLTPPEWLQQAADQMGIPGGPERSGGTATPATPATPSAPSTPSATDTGTPASPETPAATPANPATPVPPRAEPPPPPPTPDQSGQPATSGQSGAGQTPAPAAPAWPDAHSSDDPTTSRWNAADIQTSSWNVDTAAWDGAWNPDTGEWNDAASSTEARGTSQEGAPGGDPNNPWDAADTSRGGSGTSVPPPQTVLSSALEDNGDEDTPPPVSPDAKTALLPDGSRLPKTAINPALRDPSDSEKGQDGQEGAPSEGSDGSGQGVHHAATMLADPQPGGPSRPGAGDIADAETRRAQPPQAPGAPGARSGSTPPPPPGAPGTPGARPAPSTPQPAAPGAGGGYVPTQLVSADEVSSAGQQSGQQPGQQPGQPPHQQPGQPPAGGVHHAATVLSGPGGPSTPPPPGPGAPPPQAPPQGPAQPPPFQGPPASAAYGFPQPPPPAPAYGYPQMPGQPMVGPGYMAVLRYRAPDGSEQQLIRRSAPGTPHPEWQILHELRAMNVPPQQVLELHTELESCDLPGGYCARMIRENWPQVRLSSTAAYGRDHASRQQGMRHLLEHQGELHQVADGPARPAPYRVPLPPPHQVPVIPPIPPDGIGHELFQAFGPQGVFRFDQHAVSRHGVPDIVGQTLVWAGVPREFPPFFWGQAVPGRPIPTLAELAHERGVQPASDSGSYLVMGQDFGRQICVQYGTAHIVAVPMEAGPGGQPQPPQFVNTGLPEFVRCLALLGRMWPLRYGLTPDQAGRWTVDFQMQLAGLDPAALSSAETWWSVLLEQMWDGLL